MPLYGATAGRYAGNITGNGILTSFAVPHGLGTKDVIAEVYDTDTGSRVALADVVHDSASQVTVVCVAAPILNKVLRVVVG